MSAIAVPSVPGLDVQYKQHVESVRKQEQDRRDALEQEIQRQKEFDEAIALRKKIELDRENPEVELGSFVNMGRVATIVGMLLAASLVVVYLL